MRALASSALVVAVALVGSSPAAANPIDAFGFGARGPAMGGAQTAASDDGGANYYNPAALARAAALRLDLGYHYANPRLALDGGDQAVAPSHGMTIALTVPARVRGRRLATLGVGVYMPDEHILLARTLPGSQPRWALYDNRPQRLFVGAHLAVAIGEDVSVGAGAAWVADTAGSYTLTGRLGFPDAADSDLALDIDVDATPVSYAQAGVLWRARPWLDVGASYRGEYVLDSLQVVAFRADIGPAGSPVIPDGVVGVESVSLDLFQPAQLAIGAAARITPRLLVAADATYQRWSRFRNPTPVIAIDLDVGMFNDLVDPAILAPQPPLVAPRFHDTVSLRVGAELAAWTSRHVAWQLRGGYAWEPSPAPEQIGATNFVDNDKHTLSAGVGARIRDAIPALALPFDVDGFVAASVLPARAHRKLSPADPIGDYVSRGVIVAGGVTTSWRF